VTIPNNYHPRTDARMRTVREAIFETAILLVAGGAIFAVACGSGEGRSSAKDAAAARIERGKYLVTFGGCNDCHTPMKMGAGGPEPDMSRMLSGHPSGVQVPAPPKLPEGPWGWVVGTTNTVFAGPWGISYSPNLTPDEASGIGVWSEAMFIKTLRSGRHWGQSRPILPPMPWREIGALTDDDLKSIFAYLRSIPPVRNGVPSSEPAPAPGSQQDQAHS
jgi:hypothetical protein